MQLIELWYYIWSTPYYDVTVINDMEVIKHIIQPVVSKENGFDIAIIDKKLKMAWWKIDGICFRHGKKFLMTVDINNAIPLIEKKKVEESGDLVIKQMNMVQLIENVAFKTKNNTGQAKEFVKIEYPPTVLFQELEGHYVKKVIEPSPDSHSGLREALPYIVL